jgi:hypothetical protein
MALAVNISGLCSRMFNVLRDMVKTGEKYHKQTEENTNK